MVCHCCCSSDVRHCCSLQRHRSVDTYIYLLDYIKTQCVPQRAEETDQKEEWLILRGVNSYRILWKKTAMLPITACCILRAYASDEGIRGSTVWHFCTVRSKSAA
ncbi:MAG: hypothetical protein ACLVJ6_09390 [Merdibacter sp.]